MTVQDIESFLTVVKTGSLTKSAQILFVTQPALSRRLRSLEEEVGFPLITRQPGVRQITLTEKGKAFLTIAEQWLRLWQETIELRDEAPVQRLAIASIESINIYILAPVCRLFMREHPTLQLALKNQYSSQAYQDVSNGLVDLGIINNVQHMKGIDCLPAFQETMYFVCRRDYRSGEAPVHPQDLDASRGIYVPWSVDFEVWYRYWFSNSIPCRLYAQNIPLLQEYILEEDIWTIAPSSVTQSLLKHPNIAAYTLESAPPDRISYFLIKHGNQPLYFSKFCRRLKESLELYPGIEVLY